MRQSGEHTLMYCIVTPRLWTVYIWRVNDGVGLYVVQCTIAPMCYLCALTNFRVGTRCSTLLYDSGCKERTIFGRTAFLLLLPSLGALLVMVMQSSVQCSHGAVQLIWNNLIGGWCRWQPVHHHCVRATQCSHEADALHKLFLGQLHSGAPGHLCVAAAWGVMWGWSRVEVWKCPPPPDWLQISPLMDRRGSQPPTYPPTTLVCRSAFKL